MRAGLIAGALLATLAVSEPAFAQNPVPCSSRGDGTYNCDWFRAGDGKSGGAIVAVGTTTVGYLHQGTNWIVCQQKGGDVRSAEGYRNHWFAWTTADNNRQGWASAVDARGGDDYGQFGGGVPNCNGAHGSPPSYNGVWGSPPNPSPGAPVPTDPTTPAVDADQDNVPAGTDCDDFNNQIYPGAPEVVGDGRDQDCNGADAAGRVSALVGFRGDSASTLDEVQVAEGDRRAGRARACTSGARASARAARSPRDVHDQRQGQRVADEDVPQAPEGRRRRLRRRQHPERGGKVRQLSIRRDAVARPDALPAARAPSTRSSAEPERRGPRFTRGPSCHRLRSDDRGGAEGLPRLISCRHRRRGRRRCRRTSRPRGRSPR